MPRKKRNPIEELGCKANEFIQEMSEVFNGENEEEKGEILDILKSVIKECTLKAQDVVAGTYVEDQAMSYCIPHILMSLDNENDYIGESLYSFQEAIDELTDGLEDDDEDDDEDD